MILQNHEPIHIMNYTVYVDDNFNFMDEDERTVVGIFETYEAATEKCRAIVNASLKSLNDGSMTADALYEDFTSHGEDPFIRPNPPHGTEPFSAWKYAEARCVEMGCLTNAKM